MKEFESFLANVDAAEQRARLEEIFAFIMREFPTLKPKIAWNQPMFTENGTFIIGFSVAKGHIAVAPEEAAILRFSEDAKQAGCSLGKKIIRMPWELPVPYPLLKEIITFQRAEKEGCKTFWRQ